MASPQRLSISQRLTRLNMLVSGAALLLAGAAFAAYDALTYGDTLVNSLSVQAQIIAANSISAVIFDDPATANETLAALAASPDIVAADILTADGRPLPASAAAARRGSWCRRRLTTASSNPSDSRPGRWRWRGASC